MRSAIFPLHLSKVLRLRRKIDARSYEVLHLSRKIILANLQIWCSKMQPLSGNQRPDLLTSLMNMSFVLRLPQKMHLCRSSSDAPRLPWFLDMRQKPRVLLTFDIIWTSKSGANMWCFVHFDCGMCLAPQRACTFLHLNFQKWSGSDLFCTFWLGHVLRAGTACTFFDIPASTSAPKLRCFVKFYFEMCFAPPRCGICLASQLPKVVWTWCLLYILTSKCASRHNGVQFFISHLASWLRTRRFSEPTFRPSGATNHWKNTVFSRLSYLFAHLDLLSSETFSFWFSFFFSSLLWLFPSLLFIWPYCRKFDF